MEGIALVLMLFELIGLKIIFDVALRDVGTTPSLGHGHPVLPFNCRNRHFEAGICLLGFFIY